MCSVQLLNFGVRFARIIREVSADCFPLNLSWWGRLAANKIMIVPKNNYVLNMLPVAINPGTFQEMAPLLAMFLWKNENHNIGIRKILEIDKSKLLFGGRVSFWFSPPETERGPVWFYPEEAQAQPCLLKIRAIMLSPLKNQVPRWHDSPQLEPKGLLLA